MRRICCVILVGLCCWGVASGAWAYKRDKTSSGVPLKWMRLPIEYAVDWRGAPSLDGSDLSRGTPGSEFRAIDLSFLAWSSVQCPGGMTRLRFQSKGRVRDMKVGTDEKCYTCNTNLIIFRPKEAWTHAADSVAITTTKWDNNTGELFDADMELNGKFVFTTATDTPEQVGWDVQNVVTHEIGHMIGLGHSNSIDATMYFQSTTGELNKRTLDRDDINGVCEIYPGEGGGKVPVFRQVERNADLGCSTGRPPSSGGALLYLLFLGCLLWWRRRQNPTP